METGFNFVEVPGPENRKVAENKQQGHRTANSKKSSSSCNSFKINTFFTIVSSESEKLQVLRTKDAKKQKSLKKGPFIFLRTDLDGNFGVKLQKTNRVTFLVKSASGEELYFGDHQCTDDSGYLTSREILEIGDDKFKIK